VISQRRPMTEIMDRTAYAKPASFSEATGRMQKNLNYFKINYLIATMGILSAFILYHPTSLLILSAISAAWCYVFMIRQEPLKIGERALSEREKMLGMGGLSALAIFFLSSAGTVIFSGFGVALLGVAAHSAARVPDDLFIDDAAESNGFFSFMLPPRAGQPSGTI
jgi:PRA1 family protein 1